MDIVKIEWLDAQKIDFGLNKIEDVKDIIKPASCEIVGFLINEDSRFVYLAQEYWKSEGMIKYINAIPKSLILKRKKLT